MGSLSIDAASAAMELASASAQQVFQTAMLKNTLNAEKAQATLLLDAFETANQSRNSNINTDMTRSIRPHLGVSVDLYI